MVCGTYLEKNCPSSRLSNWICLKNDNWPSIIPTLCGINYNSPPGVKSILILHPLREVERVWIDFRISHWLLASYICFFDSVAITKAWGKLHFATKERFTRLQSTSRRQQPSWQAAKQLSFHLLTHTSDIWDQIKTRKGVSSEIRPRMILRPDHQERHQIWICCHLSRCPDSPAADVGSSPDKGGGGCEGGDGAGQQVASGVLYWSSQPPINRETGYSNVLEWGRPASVVAKAACSFFSSVQLFARIKLRKNKE